MLQLQVLQQRYVMTFMMCPIPHPNPPFKNDRTRFCNSPPSWHFKLFLVFAKFNLKKNLFLLILNDLAELGKCDTRAEWNILFFNETKWYEIWPRPKDWIFMKYARFCLHYSKFLETFQTLSNFTNFKLIMQKGWQNDEKANIAIT